MLSYHKRIDHFKHPTAQRLLRLMEDKKTNLALSADVTTKKELLALAEEIGPEICILKTHIDIIEDFDQDLTHQLKKIAQAHQFLLFEDRKFADIGNTVQQQYRGGIYHIADWADMINAHSLPGDGIIQGLKTAKLGHTCGLLLLAEMSSSGNLLKNDYVAATLEMAKQHADTVFGFIAQHRLLKEPDFIYMTPGIGIAETGDNLGQNYLHPNTAIIDKGADVIIVGRHIYRASNPLTAAKEFRELGWNGYLQRIHD